MGSNNVSFLEGGMKTGFQIGLFAIAGLCTFSVFGQTGGSVPLDDFARKGELRYRMANGDRISRAWNGADTQKPVLKKKKPAVGILLSAAVPGGGEIYSGSWIKGVLFLGAEIALWTGYSTLSKEGKKWEDIFQVYADDHWSRERWEANKQPGDPDTHTLPDTKTQQYYEMIGKYDQFQAGWDSEEGSPEKTRDYYETLRDKSNRYLIQASYCTMAVLANHLISALDTGWTIRRYNRRMEGRMRVGFMNRGRTSIPLLSFEVTW